MSQWEKVSKWKINFQLKQEQNVNNGSQRVEYKITSFFKFLWRLFREIFHGKDGRKKEEKMFIQLWLLNEAEFNPRITLVVTI